MENRFPPPLPISTSLQTSFLPLPGLHSPCFCHTFPSEAMHSTGGESQCTAVPSCHSLFLTLFHALGHFFLLVSAALVCVTQRLQSLSMCTCSSVGHLWPEFPSDAYLLLHLL